MNGIEQITERIQADIQAEIDEIHENSRREAEAIGERYEAARQEEYWKVINQGTKTAEQRMQRIASMAELDSKKALLSQKQNLVSQAFDRAVGRMAALPEEDYVALLAGFAVQGAVTGSEELIFSKPDRANVGKKVCVLANEKLEKMGKKGSLTMSEDTREMGGGIIISDGSIDTNYSLDALVAARRNELTEPITKILFD